MPQISSFYGISIYMYGNEHNPPHFHVWYDNYKAVINIESGEVKGNLPRRVLQMVYEWLDLHKPELLENWELLRMLELPKKIEPLQ